MVFLLVLLLVVAALVVVVVEEVLPELLEAWLQAVMTVRAVAQARKNFHFFDFLGFIHVPQFLFLMVLVYGAWLKFF